MLINLAILDFTQIGIPGRLSALKRSLPVSEDLGDKRFASELADQCGKKARFVRNVHTNQIRPSDGPPQNGKR